MDLNSAFISAEAGLKNNNTTEPPPLPPRSTPVSAPPPRGVEMDAANSLSKQMSYPLVSTCTPLQNSYVSKVKRSRRLYFFLLLFFFVASFCFSYCAIVNLDVLLGFCMKIAYQPTIQLYLLRKVK